MTAQPSGVQAEAVTARAGDPTMPRWPQPDGRVKLSAAWLIEHAGFTRGEREGAVGLSTRHTLAIVAHDGALNQVGRFRKPRKMAPVARIHSGTVITLGDSCGVPWPR